MQSIYNKIKLINGEICRTRLLVLEGSLEVTLLENGKAWEAKIQKPELAPFAKHNRISIDEYCVELAETIQKTPENVTFSITNQTFTINKLLKDSELKIKYFEHSLNEVDYVASVEHILDHISTDYTSISEKHAETLSKKYEMQVSADNFRKKLEELVARKQLEDDELLGQFVLILNEKKKRIQHLNELLLASRNDGSKIAQKRKINGNLNAGLNKQPKREIVSETEEESSPDCNTDEDTEEQGEASPKPSTSRMVLETDDEIFNAEIAPPKPIQLKEISQKVELKKSDLVLDEKKVIKEVNFGKNAVSAVETLNTQDLFSDF